jgi:hypothetical protein
MQCWGYVSFCKDVQLIQKTQKILFNQFFMDGSVKYSVMN